jgi:hypothetical protein
VMMPRRTGLRWLRAPAHAAALGSI